nr:hypothetical protein [Tanacetum cinerariifolium]
PLVVSCHSGKMLRKDPLHTPDEFSEEAYMDLFVFIYHADPTKVKVGEREIREGEVPLLELTKYRVVLLAGVYDQGNAAAVGVGNDDVNEGSDDDAATKNTEHSGHVVRLGGIKILADDEAQALVADKPKKFRKRKTIKGAGSSGISPKKLRGNHGTSGDAGAITARKSLAALQDLLDKSTLAAEIGVTAAATVPFVTSCVTPTPGHEGGEDADSVSAADVRTKRPTERCTVPTSSVLIPAILTAVVATSVVAGTSILQPKEVNEPTRASIFVDSTSMGNVDSDAVGPSQPAGNDISSKSFYVSLDMDFEALRQVYVPKWDVLNDSLLDDPSCGSKDAFGTCTLGKKRLEGRCVMQEKLLKEKDIANVEAAKAARACEQESLKKRNVALEFATVAKDTEIAKLSQDLSQLQLSCDDLSIKASTVECEKVMRGS